MPIYRCAKFRWKISKNKICHFWQAIYWWQLDLCETSFLLLNGSHWKLKFLTHIKIPRFKKNIFFFTIGPVLFAPGTKTDYRGSYWRTLFAVRIALALARSVTAFGLTSVWQASRGVYHCVGQVNPRPWLFNSPSIPHKLQPIYQRVFLRMLKFSENLTTNLKQTEEIGILWMK
jgi:hypothetical protein